jgi:hypothetical protein
MTDSTTPATTSTAAPIQAYGRGPTPRTIPRAVHEAREAWRALLPAALRLTPRRPSPSAEALAEVTALGADPDLWRWAYAAQEGDIRAARTLARRAERAAEADPEGALAFACLARVLAYRAAWAYRERGAPR